MTATPKRVWSSKIQFQPYPGAPDAECIDLGFAVEFATKGFWVVGCATRSSLDEARLSAFDDLTRGILTKRDDVIRGEFERALSKAEKPGQVLQLLASNNPWSFSVAVPDARADLAPLLGRRNAEKTFELVIESVLGIRNVDPKPAKKKAQTAKKGATKRKTPTCEPSTPPQFYRISRPDIAHLAGA